MRRRLPFILVVLLILTPVVWADQEQDDETISSPGDIKLRGWGLRVGLADDPDQIVGGAHWDLGRIVENLRLQPNVELGVGDDDLTLFGSIPVHYLFQIDSDFTPYVGGGVVLGVVEHDRPEQAGGDDTEVEGGLRVIGGLQWLRKSGKPFAIEMNLGIGDIHDLQIKVAWTF
jgi:opacity protein-like surface antigen